MFTRIISISARLGTAILLMVLVWSCGTVPGLKDEESGSFIRVPFVRVLLSENQPEAELSADHSFAIECLSGGEQSVYYSSKPVTVRSLRAKVQVLNHNGQVIHERASEVNIIPRGTNNRTEIGGKPYRGIIRILPYGDNVRLVNILYIEDYLRGVVPPELGQRNEDEIEAVKAQAVAARTYAMGHMQQYDKEPYDLKASVYDQVYEGYGVENRLVNKAIDATVGTVASFQDKLIGAYYHSTCGGMTDDIAHVWDRESIPYLKAVEDSSSCSWSKYYRWKEVFTEDQLRGRLEQYLSGDRGKDLRMGEIRTVEVRERTPGGRVAKLEVHTETDTYRFQKDRIRWAIGRASNPDLILPSDRFDVIIERDNSGGILRVVFDGSGYGHGVGMCQCGAIGMSRTGHTYDQILRRYYAGIDLKRLY